MKPDREIAAEPVVVPPSLAERVAGMHWARATVGAGGAAIHRLSAPDKPSLYLKHGTAEAAEEVTAEMVRLRWLGKYVATPEVHAFVSTEDQAWLLMSAVPGLTAYQLLVTNPENCDEIVTVLAEHLRALHAIPADQCPFNAAHPLRLAEARRRMAAGRVDASDFDDDHQGWTAEQIWAEMTSCLPFEPDLVVTHGDYSLDNILIEDGRVTGVLDLGRAGTADRYQDLAILWNCLGEFGGALQSRLFTAYGIARPDLRKLRFHLALDEFF
jgi:aminoglycoside 3'-phosphotransferase I